MKGKFIVLDGSEGAGKSSQIEKLKTYFGDSVITTREPGGSPYAEEIREIILNSPNSSQADGKTLFALFWAARADHLKNTIIPKLESGKNVICDRFDSSTYAYQIFGQESFFLKDTFFIFRDLFLGEYKPNKYIYLSVDPETGLSRKNKQGTEINYFEEKELNFYKRMQNGFDDFFRIVGNSVNVDATPPFDVVTKSLIVEIDKILKSQ